MKMLQGITASADYSPSQIKRYYGNPAIEALPEIFSVDEAKNRFTRLPDYDTDERNLPAHLRLHCVNAVKYYVFPSSRLLNLEQCISRMIREGYVSRNPLKTTYVKMLHNGYSKIQGQNVKHELISTSADGCAIVGLPGVGKTTATENILLSYPQIIRHNKYNGTDFTHTQIVWLKMDCPHDGSIKGLCLSYFAALDTLLGTSYYDKFKNCTKDKLLLHMSQTASLYSLGLLVIDEAQNLSQAKSGGQEQMINFFVQLINTIGLPVLIIGNPKSLNFLGGEFRTARRTAGQSEIFWNPAAKGKEWDFFLSQLWAYQWVNNYSPLTEELNKTMFEESQGILDIAVKLYTLAQWRAIATGYEKINETLIKSVSKDCLSMLKPMLNALRSNNVKFIERFKDIYIPMDKYFNEFQQQLSTRDQYDESSNAAFEVAQIAQWLIQAGIDNETAFKCANLSFRNKMPEDDKKSVRTSALALANGEQNNVKENTSVVERPKRTQKSAKNKRKNSVSTQTVKEPKISERDIKKLPA